MSEKLSILMVAAENDALPATKVGGIGDVVRDIPQALANENCEVKVVLPDYGHQTGELSSECVDYFSVMFRGVIERVALYKVKPKESIVEHENISYWLISHPEFMPCGQGQVYCHDDKNRPFATDATKYAFFCAAVAQNLIQGGFGGIDVLHLHDWHSAFLAILREYDITYSALKSIKTVYTIHNLALQGVRPFEDDESSLEQWFPHLRYDKFILCDPRFPHCLNPMRAGIELSDKVHAVSPTYAKEIQAPSRLELGVYGGEGLESALQKAMREGRLYGILNGCEYNKNSLGKKLSKTNLIAQCKDVLIDWACKYRHLSTFHWIAEKRLDTWSAKKDRGFLVTSVGRITDQKVRLLMEQVELNGKHASTLDHLLDTLSGHGVLLLLGSGQAEFENFLLKVVGRHENFIFLHGYSEALAKSIYASGDLFLMPSSFEPCGISQMLAMRAGQPCLVHEVGGLKDTVIDGETGFSFNGDNLSQQSLALVEKFKQAMQMSTKNKKQFSELGKKAKLQRFTWQSVAKEYLEKLYN